MLTVIAIFGILIILVSAYGSVNTPGLLSVVHRFANRSGYTFAIAVRVVLGIFAILAAPASRAPAFLYLVGGIAWAAAIVLALIGMPGYRRIIDWVSGFGAGMLRIGLTLGLLFGMALVWVSGVV